MLVYELLPPAVPDLLQRTGKRIAQFRRAQRLGEKGQRLREKAGKNGFFVCTGENDDNIFVDPAKTSGGIDAVGAGHFHIKKTIS